MRGNRKFQDTDVETEKKVPQTTVTPISPEAQSLSLSLFVGSYFPEIPSIHPSYLLHFNITKKEHNISDMISKVRRLVF